MKTNIILSLDTRRPKKDNTYPLILRLSHHRKTTSISVGRSIAKEHWDHKKRMVKRSYGGVSSVSRFNNQLLKEKTKATDIINDLAENGQLDFLSVAQIKDRIVHSKTYQSFFAFGEQCVKELKQAKRIGNARSYDAVINVLKGFMNDDDLAFNELNYDFLKRFEQYHLAKEGNTLNGLASYMRTIRAIYNKGIKAGLIEREAYPFDLYKIKQEPTEKRALDKDSLKAIMSLNLSPDHPLFDARNYFILSYMLYGISFIDLAFLKGMNIKDGRVTYRRKKTGKLYDIRITEQIKEIIHYYQGNKGRADFIFPIIKRAKLEDQYADARWALKRYNKRLKDLATLCEIDQTLTSYVSRHSFATQALLMDVPVVAISQMLGHAKLNTTQVYLKSLPNNILDDYQEKIILL
ncbi:MAG: site-specific integrase [Bacteroidota bacterium]